MEVVRTGSRYTFPLQARRAFRRMDGKRFDLLVEDVNKSPLFTPRWSATPVAVLVPHLFGTTVFREAWLPVASAVWLADGWPQPHFAVHTIEREMFVVAIRM